MLKGWEKAGGPRGCATLTELGLAEERAETEVVRNDHLEKDSHAVHLTSPTFHLHPHLKARVRAMAKKPASNGSVPPATLPGHSPRPLGPLSVLADKEKLKQREEDVTKINNMNASDLKNACDDALKRVRFTPIAFCHD